VAEFLVTDGRFILYWSSQNNGDLMVLPMTGDRKPFPFPSTPFNEVQGVFSPDGKWVAYQSNESGRFEVYVRPFPGPGGQWQVSTGGGISPRWQADGEELYYVARDNKLMGVAASAQGRTFVPGMPPTSRRRLVRHLAAQAHLIRPQSAYFVFHSQSAVHDTQ
jgi:Tol biopolymer transport system component